MENISKPQSQFLNILWMVGHIAWPITLHWRRNKKANLFFSYLNRLGGNLSSRVPSDKSL